MLKSAKNGMVVRMSFSLMKYMGKYKESKKATDIKLVEIKGEGASDDS